MISSSFEGGCLCGAVRYRVQGEPLARAVCHCRTCRKTASAPALPFLTYPTTQFSYLRGAPAEFHSSPGVTRSFCGRCGSPLTYRTDNEPGQLDVMSCTLDDPEAFPPAYHIWVSHKLTWDPLADGVPAYDTTAPI
jgi:hypothetical protein